MMMHYSLVTSSAPPALSSAASMAAARPAASARPSPAVMGRPPRRLGRLAVRAHKNHGDRSSNRKPYQLPREPNHFVDERNSISCRFMDIYGFGTLEGFLYEEATSMSANVCLSAAKAVTMASEIVADSASNCSAATTTTDDDGTTMISSDTIQMTLKAYVDVFVKAAEDSYHRRVTTCTVTSFLDALRGLASISHILLEAALSSREISLLSEYAFNFNRDVKTLHRQFQCQMTDLEDAFTKAPSHSKECELVLPTIRQGVKVTQSFLRLMAARRQRALLGLMPTKVDEPY